MAVTLWLWGSRMVKIKICGMRREEDIEMANRYKPDYIGFVFADSPRKVTFDQAKELSSQLNEDIMHHCGYCLHWWSRAPFSFPLDPQQNVL